MALSKISNLSLADQVFQQLTAEIMRGSYAPDSHLPAERTLSLTFHVNRHVVREALKRLEQLGLIHVAQGGGTRVLDFRRHAGLDLLALLAEHPRSGREGLSFWYSVLEVRAAQGREIARLCATRASRAIKQELVEIANEMQRATDDETLYALALTFWDRAVEGADNIVYRLSLNSMTRAAAAMGDEAKRWSVHEIKQAKFHMPLAAAIASGDARAAEAHVRVFMQTGLDALAELLKQPRRPKPPQPATPPKPTSTRTPRTAQPRAAKRPRTLTAR